ncbi:MAG: NADH-quinone oxidoreductase subunit C, partial [Bacteroidales bacterium]|nr:NADH-quinone oxidoreductase subunit C [Bacteroidales bacterium]
MNTIKTLIQNICPQAVFSEGEKPVPEVELTPRELADLLLPLREEKGLQFDYLEDLIGMDFGEQLGVIYRLYSTVNKHWVVLVCKAESREHPTLPTLSHLWAIADFYEREVFDFFGILFIGHPDMRRLFLRQDWTGYPLRKDYDASSDLNPLRLEAEPMRDDTDAVIRKEDGETAEEKHVVFDKDEYVVNIGPQHPATHGVLHFQVSLEGEIVKKVDVHCGYIHRGIEKMCESLTYPQTLAMTDRLDYLSAHQNRHALCACIEEAMGLEIPTRALYIR